MFSQQGSITSTPIYSGTTIFNATQNKTCESSYFVQKGVDEYLVTAGHCGDIGDIFFIKANREFIGRAAYKYYSHNTDVLLISVPDFDQVSKQLVYTDRALSLIGYMKDIGEITNKSVYFKDKLDIERSVRLLSPGDYRLLFKGNTPGEVIDPGLSGTLFYYYGNKVMEPNGIVIVGTANERVGIFNSTVHSVNHLVSMGFTPVTA